MLVLIADEDPSARQSAREAIERFGYRCAEAETGAIAWDRIVSGLPDVVLASVHLPEVSGIELARRLRELQRKPSCYLVTLVDVDDGESLFTAMASGADDFLARPFTDEQLHARMQVAERFTLLVRQLDERELSLERVKLALRASARTDTLTGLWNRVQLTDDLDLFQGQLVRYGHRYAAVIMNLDQFRTYNDTYGQLAGDEALRLVSHTVAQQLRTGDRAYRYGGDELVVLLPEQSADSARVAANRIREAIHGLAVPHPANTPSGVLTVSVGVAAFDAVGADTYNALLGHAEAALLRAKNTGGNQVAWDGAPPE